MSFKAIFSRKERIRIRAEMAVAAATAELAAKREVLRKAPEVSKFLSWFEEQTIGKHDKDINWVELGYEAHDRYWNLVQKYPEVAELTGCDIQLTASDRYYSWLDDEGFWNNWKKEKMDSHYRSFKSQEDRFAKEGKKGYGDYRLEDIGPMGGGDNYPYASCAYLSYAYFEKGAWQLTVQTIKELIGA